MNIQMYMNWATSTKFLFPEENEGRHFWNDVLKIQGVFF